MPPPSTPVSPGSPSPSLPRDTTTSVCPVPPARSPAHSPPSRLQRRRQESADRAGTRSRRRADADTGTGLSPCRRRRGHPADPVAGRRRPRWPCERGLRRRRACALDSARPAAELDAPARAVATGRRAPPRARPRPLDHRAQWSAHRGYRDAPPRPGAVQDHPSRPDLHTDAAAVARYIRITRLRANLSALDPVADADCAVGLAAELHVLESYSRRVPSTDDRTVR